MSSQGLPSPFFSHLLSCIFLCSYHLPSPLYLFKIFIISALFFGAKNPIKKNVFNQQEMIISADATPLVFL